MFRQVSLPAALRGALYLHAMPARYESWDAFTEELARCRVENVVSLASEEEIREKSPAYAEAIQRGALPFHLDSFPVPDFGVPSDFAAYFAFVARAARRIRMGKSLLVHCGAGIGRTGTFAISLLLALGSSLDDASRLVEAAGSHPETDAQRDFLVFASKFFRDFPLRSDTPVI